MLFYTAYLFPIFEYCCNILWKENRKIYMPNLENTNSNLKNYSRPSKEKTIRKYILKIKILPVKERCIFHTGVQVFKALNHTSPQYIRALRTISKNQKYNLRSITHGNVICLTNHVLNILMTHSNLIPCFFIFLYR
jgi:hypothetical protein